MSREDLYKYFGPLLLEAIVLVIKDEINILRVHSSLGERTDQQIVTAIEEKLKVLSEYDWMKSGP